MTDEPTTIATPETVELDDALIVCVGRSLSSEGKLCDLFAPLDVARPLKDDQERLRRVASLFASKSRPTVGAVYQTNATLVGNRVTSLGVHRTYKEMLDGEALRAGALHARGLEQQEEAKRAEAKVRKVPVGGSCISELAAMVSRAPIGQQETMISGIAAAIRKEAMDVWRKGGRR